MELKLFNPMAQKNKPKLDHSLIPSHRPLTNCCQDHSKILILLVSKEREKNDQVRLCLRFILWKKGGHQKRLAFSFTNFALFFALTVFASNHAAAQTWTVLAGDPKGDAADAGLADSAPGA